MDSPETAESINTVEFVNRIMNNREFRSESDNVRKMFFEIVNMAEKMEMKIKTLTKEIVRMRKLNKRLQNDSLHKKEMLLKVNQENRRLMGVIDEQKIHFYKKANNPRLVITGVQPSGASTNRIRDRPMPVSNPLRMASFNAWEVSQHIPI
jgi:hypothetical protein